MPLLSSTAWPALAISRSLSAMWSSSSFLPLLYPTSEICWAGNLPHHCMSACLCLLQLSLLSLWSLASSFLSVGLVRLSSLFPRKSPFFGLFPQNLQNLWWTVQAAVRSSEERVFAYFPRICRTCGGMCRLLSEAVRRMTHEDIISLAKAEHGHPMKLIDLAQVWCLLHTHLRHMR